MGRMTIAVRTVQGTTDTLNWILGDHLGSTSVTANEDGSWNSTLKYTAFGEVRYNSGITPTEYRFTNQLEQIEIGLYYYGARWYDSVSAHFVQADTYVPESQGVKAWDRYAYVLNSPLKYTDPSGHWVVETNKPEAEVRIEAYISASNRTDNPYLVEYYSVAAAYYTSVDNEYGAINDNFQLGRLQNMITPARINGWNRI